MFIFTFVMCLIAIAMILIPALIIGYLIGVPLAIFGVIKTTEKIVSKKEPLSIPEQKQRMAYGVICCWLLVFLFLMSLPFLGKC